MPEFKRKLTYLEIKTAISLWLKEHDHIEVKPEDVRVIVDHGGGNVMDPGFVTAKVETAEFEVEVNFFEIKQAIELWLRKEKNLIVTFFNGIKISEDRGGGTPVDSGTGISGEAPVRNK